MMNVFLRQQMTAFYWFVKRKQFKACLEELTQTQWLRRDELITIQQDKLHRLLVYAYTFVPYYRNLFNKVGFQPADILSDRTSFLKIPTISKADIINNFDDLVTKDPSRQKTLFRNSTGGSTGRPLDFMQDTNFKNYQWADIYRHLLWIGWQPGECHAWIWGADYERTTKNTPRTLLRKWLFNRIYTNAFALSEESILAFIRQIRQKRPKVLVGYASALERFALFVQEHALSDIQFNGIISTAEVLYQDQREIIEKTFGCMVLNRYGSREFGAIACECPENMDLHMSVENVYIEILRNGVPVPIGEEGEIVITSLNNYGMPFIRYQQEDVARLSPGNARCQCGRGLPTMEVVLGRTSNMFKTSSGGTVHGEFFTHLFYGISEVKQFQVIQQSYDHILILMVKRTSLPAERLSFIERAIKDVMKSEVKVEFQFMESIPPASSGKYLFTISKVH